jgi:hypothetical protein
LSSSQELKNPPPGNWQRIFHWPVRANVPARGVVLCPTFARGPSTPILDHTGATIYRDRAGNHDLSIAQEG